MLEYLLLALVLAGFGYTTGVLKHLGNRIDILYGLMNRIQTNEIVHLQAGFDKLMKKYKEDEAKNASLLRR